MLYVMCAAALHVRNSFAGYVMHSAAQHVSSAQSVQLLLYRLQQHSIQATVLHTHPHLVV